MIIRKILASSTHALIATLTNIKLRLERMLESEVTERTSINDYISDIDDIELWVADYEEEFEDEGEWNDNDEKIDIAALQEEINTLQGFIDKAKQIGHDSKSDALLSALEQSFKIQEESGANRKALIFTESTKTQS
jgi:hypothetical protein